jgi:transcriptional regulator with XRE-family HTH domain
VVFIGNQWGSVQRSFCFSLILSHLPLAANEPVYRLVRSYSNLRAKVTIPFPQMPPQKLDNYLLTFRKRSGLTQREVAFLFGCENGAQVSRYEKRRRLPPLETALACEAVFGAPVSELFAGVRDAARKEVYRRLLLLKSRLEANPGKGSEARMTAQKLRWLAERHGIAAETQ